jgi:hypothetical protein
VVHALALTCGKRYSIDTWARHTPSYLFIADITVLCDAICEEDYDYCKE